ncbi:NF-kappa-B inhibitor zeta-like isoform X2 [Tympanuchus pallidicinctus]|uniref:NF-kappa-B inhibitor zeta-like isoform X2 n=1 Tax=Tympanuchus pallidicinctus TaxID=109042 RepID=UPI00228744FC|nr:NF-kappa-B inhibitor zeta-like isoform X2 [Tympanuchus pallidicinctus]
MLQTVCTSPELLVKQNITENESCGYSPGQGSPQPGETASPKRHFQQSPSLPDSGLTELNVASPEIYPAPPHKPPAMSAPTDSALGSDPPPRRRYMGVRVKMPVRELLRKVRLSRGLQAAASQEASSVRTASKGSSGKTEKRRVHPYTEKQLRQSKQSIGQTLKGLEDLDILVEVLQEDLNKSQLKKESLRAAPDGFWQGFPAELQAPWWGAGGSKQAAGSVQERCQSFTKLRSHCCFTDCSSALQEEVESSFCDGQKDMQEPDSPGTFSRTREKESSWWMQGVGSSTQKHCWAQPAQSTSPCFDPPGAHPEPFVEADSDSLGSRGCSRQTSIAFTQQDLSAISFFQFQLHREESLLRNIPADKLLAPDENGNRLLHKAVAQGRRALTYALARRFASLNKIDEKDAEKRTALHLAAEKNQHLMVGDLISLGANVNEQDGRGKTPLHLCAENGYLRVLEVLKNCKDGGVCVAVNVADHCGLTPLHCAALAHTILATESQKTDGDSDMGRFLKLRKDQILEGINCLLHMGGKAELQVLRSCQTTAPCLKIEENTELMCLLQTHKPKELDILQESNGLLEAPGVPCPSPADHFSELLPVSPLDFVDIILKGKC